MEANKINDLVIHFNEIKFDDVNDLQTEYKRIYDCIHGYVYISNIATKIIDTKQFQRLGKLKQLGTCLYVFRNGLHTRFEHSVGTYHLAGRMLKCIVQRTAPGSIETYLKSIHELKNYYKRKYNGDIAILDDYVCELVKIAGLCHDLGHGPFSHDFDDVFLPLVKKIPNLYDSHEERSGLLLEFIIKNNKTLSEIIHPDEIQFIKNLINPKKENTGFLFQIVSNYLNGLDVDKYDYITRDSYVVGIKTGFDYTRLVDDIWIVDNTICYYPESILYEVVRLYRSRYDLHKQIYCHKSVISAKFMIVELLKLLDPILQLSTSVDDVEKFSKITDEYVLTSIHHLSQPYSNLTPEQTILVKEASLILDRIDTHNLYVFIGSVMFSHEMEITIDDFKKISDYDNNYTDDIIIFNAKIGFVSGNKKNPFDNLYSCFPAPNKGNPDEKRTLKKMETTNISYLIPELYQEYITMIFYKIRNDIIGKDKISNWFAIICKSKK